MINRDSAEYKTIANLYKDGKISAQERNKLLAALGFVGDGRKTVTFRVDGMESEFCAEQVKSALDSVEGIENVDADIKEKRVAVTGDFDAGDAINAIKTAGYLCRAVDIVIEDDKKQNAVKPDAPVTTDIFDTPDEPNEPEGFHVSINDGRSLSEFIAGLGNKISDTVKSGLKTAGNAIDGASEQIKKAANSVVSSVSNAFGGESRVIKRIAVDYDVPFEELTLNLTYGPRGKNKVTYTAKLNDVEKVKRSVRPNLSAAAYEKLCKLLDEKFTGTFKYVWGEEVLKISIED